MNGYVLRNILMKYVCKTETNMKHKNAINGGLPPTKPSQQDAWAQGCLLTRLRAGQQAFYSRQDRTFPSATESPDRL
jgi:hypothetical protein